MEKIGNSRYTQVSVVGEADEKSKANHNYLITNAKELEGNDVGFSTAIAFQKGPIKESGVNGCHNEDLLTIVLHRLNGFQSSEFRCRENAIAITKIEEALLWLGKRTSDREARNVEGTHAV